MSGVIEQPEAVSQATGLRDLTHQGSTVEKAETSMREQSDGFPLSTMNGKQSKARDLED